jgi:hypothetical protein
MAIVSLDCPNCGAKLPPREETGRTTCDYCGATFETARAHHRTTAAKPNPAAARAVGLALGVTVLAGVGASVIAFTATSGAEHAYQQALSNIPQIQPVRPMNIPGQESATKQVPPDNKADFMWDEVGGPPTVAVIDGTEHVIGRLRVRPDDQLHIAAFSDTGEQRWRLGPFGSYSDGYRATHFAVADGRVAVTDFRGKLHLYDLQTGEQKQEVALTDKAERLCMLEGPGEKPRVWLSQVDNRDFAVDLVAGALKDDKPPKGCDMFSRFSSRDGDPLSRTQERMRKAPKVDGFSAQAVHIDGAVAVARGTKSPGTAYPMVVGFDPATREVRWKSPTASVDLASVRERDNAQDAIAAGRYFATYGEGQEYWHLTGFDAKTGDRLFDHRLRSIFAVDWLYGLKATEKNLFLVRMSSVEVHDAATGALKATIGDESYDG